jgi:hypothetical protein
MKKKVWKNAEVTELGVKMTALGGKTATDVDSYFFNTKGEIFSAYHS